MTVLIKGTQLEKLFDFVCESFRAFGGNPDGWDGWPSLNKYHPSSMRGFFVKTNENNQIEGFSSHLGSHPMVGSGVAPDDSVFEFLHENLGLVLRSDRSNANRLTYSTCREKLWEVTNWDFSEFEEISNEWFSEGTGMSTEESLSEIVNSFDSDV